MRKVYCLYECISVVYTRSEDSIPEQKSDFKKESRLEKEEESTFSLFKKAQYKHFGSSEEKKQPSSASKSTQCFIHVFIEY